MLTANGLDNVPDARFSFGKIDVETEGTGPMQDIMRTLHRGPVPLALGALAALLAVVVPIAPALTPALAQDGADAALRRNVAAKHRDPANVARDQYRRPFEVVSFLGIKPTSTLLEISPGAAGYWTEILAPYVKERGLYIAANPAPLSPAAKAGVDAFNAKLAAKLAADPANYARVKVIDFAPERPDFVAPGSVDYVLTFRNLHNWMDRGVDAVALQSFHRALKKGGILGIKDHRGRTDQPQDPRAKNGYIRQDYAIALIEKAGFKLQASSEALANPKDTKDHAAGVWALPPSYRLKDQDREKYQAIGESDRFLLKFVKL